MEPSIQIGGLRGIYGARTRSVPDSEGIFRVLIMKVTQKYIQLHNRQAIGFLHPVGTKINAVEVASNSSPIVDGGNSPAVNISSDLSNDQQTRAKPLILEDRGNFPVHPKRPKKNRLIQSTPKNPYQSTKRCDVSQLAGKQKSIAKSMKCLPMISYGLCNASASY